MKDINLNDPGHTYELELFEDKSKSVVLQFIQKRKIAEDGTMKTVSDGTTNEEVLKVLIDRCGKMNAKFPSRETALGITKMEEALMWFERRTALRQVRGVEGKAIK